MTIYPRHKCIQAEMSGYNKILRTQNCKNLEFSVPIPERDTLRTRNNFFLYTQHLRVNAVLVLFKQALRKMVM